MDFKFKKSNLNFRVYTSESEPTTPGIENDIVIITSVPMTNWILSPDKPSGAPRTDGDAWIQYSAEGATFNALKNNSMRIATISAYQFIDGSWVDVTAKSYQNGVWVDWVDPVVYLYKNGDVCTSVTGGWVKRGVSDGGSMTVGSFELRENCIHVQTNGYCVSFASTVNLVDVTSFKTIEVTVLSGGWGTKHLRICPAGYTWHTGSTSTVDFFLYEGVNSFDISSLNGSYYIAIHAYSDAGTSSVVDVSEVVLK